MKANELINKVLEQQKCSLYSLGLDIGISESTLWKYRNGHAISKKSKDKIENSLKKLLTFSS